jgi:hypothetical protein
MGHRNRVTWASFLLIANNRILFFLHRLVLQAGCEHINNREGGLQVSSRSFFLHHQILIREQPCTMCFCSLQNSSRFVLIANLCLSITIYPPNENIILTPMYELQAFVELEIIPSVQIADFMFFRHNKKTCQWDVRSNEVTMEYGEHLGPVNTATLIDDDRSLISFSTFRSILIYSSGVLRQHRMIRKCVQFTAALFSASLIPLLQVHLGIRHSRSHETHQRALHAQVRRYAPSHFSCEDDV